MLSISYILGQVIFLMALAPLVNGIIKKTKAWLQNRKGPKIFQGYYDLMKYFRKDSVAGKHVSWIYFFAPSAVFISIVVAGLLLPIFQATAPLGWAGDFILFLYILAVGRFFMVLAALDTGSAFGGMGSSREMALSLIVEPAMLMVVMALAYQAGSTNLDIMVSYGSKQFIGPEYLLLAGALLILAIAETGRIPVDNPDTHLELTMIHEGMLLEYSGKYLGLMIWGAYIKQLVILVLVGNLILPYGLNFTGGFLGWLLAGVLSMGKVLCLGILLAFIETSFAKLRLFKLPNLMGLAFSLAALAFALNFILGR